MYQRKSVCMIQAVLMSSAVLQCKHILTCLRWALGTISIKSDVNHISTSTLPIRRLEHTLTYYTPEMMFNIYIFKFLMELNVSCINFISTQQVRKCSCASGSEWLPLIWIHQLKESLIGRATVWPPRGFWFDALSPSSKGYFEIGSITVIAEFGFRLNISSYQLP